MLHNSIKNEEYNREETNEEKEEEETNLGFLMLYFLIL